MKRHDAADLGPPDFKIAGLQVWIWSRQFDDAHDEDDGNWLNVSAHCGSADADVWVSGPVLHLSGLRQWLDELKNLRETLSGCARLSAYEPNLRSEIELTDGRGELTVSITPDHLTEKHEFRFPVDQSYLRELTSMLEQVFKRYPIRSEHS